MTSAAERIRELHADRVYDVHAIIETLIVEGQRDGILKEWFRELAPAGVHGEMAKIARDAQTESRERTPTIRPKVTSESRPTVRVRAKVWYEKRHPVVLYRLLAAPVGTGSGRKPWAELTVSDLDWRWTDAEAKRNAASLSQQQCEKLRAAMDEHGVKKVGHLPTQVLADIFEVPLDA